MISTNTYFGRFPASYWQRWTNFDRVAVLATGHGAGGAQAASAIRKLRADYAETVLHRASGAPELPPVRPEPTPSKPGLVLIKRIAWHLVGRSRGDAAIRAADDHWWHASLFDTVVATDPSQGGVQVRTRDRAAARALARRGARALWRLRREGAGARTRYRAAMPELTSRANWARLFSGRN